MFRILVKKDNSHPKHITGSVDYSFCMKKRSSPAENLSKNINMLMDTLKIESNRQLSEKTKVSDRMIGRIRAMDSIASIEVADKLGRPFGLTGWQMIMPNLEKELIESGKLEKLISNYTHASKEGRAVIDRVAEHEAVYNKNA